MDVIRDVPLLALLSEAERSALAPTIQRRSFVGRSVILRAGESAEGLYVIVSGRVHTYLENGDAREFLVSVLEPHDFFGETALFDGRPCPVSVESEEACDVLYVPRKRLLECLQQNAGAAVFMLRAALARIEDLHRKIEGLALMGVNGRVARVLLETGQETDGEWRVELGTEQIASMVGASREMVSRVLKGMAGGGALRRERRRVIVLDRSAIQDCVQINTRRFPARDHWAAHSVTSEQRADPR